MMDDCQLKGSNDSEKEPPPPALNNNTDISNDVSSSDVFNNNRASASACINSTNNNTDDVVQSPIVDSTQQRKEEYNHVKLIDELFVVNNDGVEADSVDGESNGKKWNVGDLIWARVGKHPLWPSMIDVDPTTNTYIKVKHIGKHHKPFIHLHVRFFGDCGRRSWVPSNTALAFHGGRAFDELANQIRVQLRNGTSSKKYLNTLQSFQIKRNHRVAWQQAVDEAEALMLKTVAERHQFFTKVIQNRTTSAKIKSTTTTTATNNNTSNRNIFKLKLKVNNNNNNNNHSKKNHVIHSSTSLYPTRDRKPVDRFISPIKVTSIVRTKASAVNHKNENDAVEAIEKNDDESFEQIVSHINESNLKQYHLFNNKSVPREKVCEICEQTMHVHRCTGPCLRYYHTRCAAAGGGSYTSGTDVDNTDAVSVCSSNDSVQIINKNRKLVLTEQEIDAKMAELMSSQCDEIKYDVDSDDENQMNYHVTGDNDNGFKCFDCTNNRLPACFVCSGTDANTDALVKCSYNQCGKHYHMKCLEKWPQTQIESHKSKTTLICPLHVCHSCVSDDPRQHTTQMKFSNDRLAKCIKCPTTYHNTTNYCLSAGCKILSLTQIICTKHCSINTHINASWCFICSKGGTLICCETCPTSFHIECLNLKKIPDVYICEECETGRLPLYNELVWVKFGKYRWWPSLILLPSFIPQNIKRPNRVGEFIIQFFGSHDYYWVHRGRVFSYQEGDSDDTLKYNNNHHSTKHDRIIHKLYIKALNEASCIYAIIKDHRTLNIKMEVKPPKYIKIKSNKPNNIELLSSLEMTSQSCECDITLQQYCGPQSSCINRLLLQECNPTTCPYGAQCLNQQFEQRKYPQLVPFKTVNLSRGWGLKTQEPIEKGQFIIEYVGEMINDQEYKRRVEEQKNPNYYFLTIDKDRILDAGPKGNVARFMNHSCEPNCETQKWTVNGTTRVGLFAIEDIPSDTELTFNYNLECIDKHKKVCKCGTPSCSGFIGVKKVNAMEGAATASSTTNGHNNVKKRKKYIAPKLRHISKNKYCFICGENRTEGQCSNRACGKTYHLACVQLREWPRENWYCPRHKCVECDKKYNLKYCSMCIKSYCKLHATDKFISVVVSDAAVDDQTRITCLNHPQQQQHPISSTSTSTVSPVQTISTTSDDTLQQEQRAALSSSTSSLSLSSMSSASSSSTISTIRTESTSSSSPAAVSTSMKKKQHIKLSLKKKENADNNKTVSSIRRLSLRNLKKNATNDDDVDVIADHHHQLVENDIENEMIRTNKKRKVLTTTDNASDVDVSSSALSSAELVLSKKRKLTDNNNYSNSGATTNRVLRNTFNNSLNKSNQSSRM